MFSTDSVQTAEVVDNFIKLDFKKSELFINHYKIILVWKLVIKIEYYWINK